MVSCYFDLAIASLTRADHVPADFLLIGLSNASRNEALAEHELEKDALARAIDADIPCGIMCDGNGNISASYLKDLGPKVALVVGFDRMSVACSSTELCHAAAPLYISDLASDAEKVALAISKMLQKHRPDRGLWKQASAFP
jgi:hypothetical protein